MELINRIFIFLASLKLAIIILVLWTIGMISGTILESYYGAEYAARSVYHSWWFYTIQVIIVINLIFSFIKRISFKRRLLGFYIVHISLVILFISSLITHYFGVDGQIEISPYDNNSIMEINKDTLEISDQKFSYIFDLPFTYKETNLNWPITIGKHPKLIVLKYLPWARRIKTDFVIAKPHMNSNFQLKALLLKYQDRKGDYHKQWITNIAPITIKWSNSSLNVFLTKKKTLLPLSLKLDHFKMDQIPGTNMPASYESFVNINNSKKLSHIYMNHPLKILGFTFYQSSYYQDKNGIYHSILSVNKDPGRVVKYLSVLLLVLGMIIHYVLNLRRVKYLILFPLFAIFSMYAQSSEICTLAGLDDLPVLKDGKIRPLTVHSTKAISPFLLSRGSGKLSDVSIYCYLSLGKRSFLEENHNLLFGLKIKHPKLKDILGMDPASSSMKLASISDKKQVLYDLYKGLNDNPGLQKALNDLLNNLMIFKKIEIGYDWNYLDQNGSWPTLSNLISFNHDLKVVMQSPKYLSSVEKRNIKLSKLYASSDPFLMANILTMLAFIFVLLSFKIPFYSILVTISYVGIISLEVYATILRILISGRAPMANMFETVMLTGLGALILGFYLAKRFKNKKILLMAVVINMVCLYMMKFATSMLDESIRPLVPVLRDNFWLSTHVTSATLAYASFVLGCFLANYVLVSFIFKRQIPKTIKNWNQIIRITMQIGVVFLTIGIILGGIWADYAWGRFWGWDPKETWSLITLVVYLIILHARYIGWFKDRDIFFCMVSIVGFLFVLMTWFGVNYLLTNGLHSYGQSSGGGKFLIAVYIAEIGVLFTSAFLWKFSFAFASRDEKTRI